jgi:beta-barrel assembly-enhancing protease
MSAKAYLKDTLILLGFLALASGVSIALVFVFGLNKNPESGKRESIPKKIELQLKEIIKKDVELEGRIIETPVILDAVKSIEKRLLARYPDFPFTPEILIIRSDVVNAASFPGGLIVVYTGLIRSTSSPEELAAVLAHELGHAYASDSMKLIVRQFTLAAIQSILGGGSQSDLPGRIIASVIDARYSQAQERAADDFACTMLEKADIDPLHLASFFETLQKKEKDSGGLILKYLGTHPDIASRIERAKSCHTQFKKNEKPFAIDWKKIQSVLPSYFDN